MIRVQICVRENLLNLPKELCITTAVLLQYLSINFIPIFTTFKFHVIKGTI
jgi:hypothetical protein